MDAFLLSHDNQFSVQAQELKAVLAHDIVRPMDNITTKINQSSGMRFLETKPLGQFIKYALVGSTSTTLDLIVLNLLVIHFHTNIYLAATAGFTIGLINGYYLNRFWTFRYTGDNHATKLAQFALVSAIGLLLNNGLLYLFIEYLGLYYNYAKLIAIVIIFFWNFLWSKYWTFRQHS